MDLQVRNAHTDTHKDTEDGEGRLDTQEWISNEGENNSEGESIDCLQGKKKKSIVSRLLDVLVYLYLKYIFMETFHRTFLLFFHQIKNLLGFCFFVCFLSG